MGSNISSKSVPLSDGELSDQINHQSIPVSMSQSVSSEFPRNSVVQNCSSQRNVSAPSVDPSLENNCHSSLVCVCSPAGSEASAFQTACGNEDMVSYDAQGQTDASPISSQPCTLNVIQSETERCGLQSSPINRICCHSNFPESNQNKVSDVNSPNNEKVSGAKKKIRNLSFSRRKKQIAFGNGSSSIKKKKSFGMKFTGNPPDEPVRMHSNELSLNRPVFTQSVESNTCRSCLCSKGKNEFTEQTNEFSTFVNSHTPMINSSCYSSPCYQTNIEHHIQQESPVDGASASSVVSLILDNSNAMSVSWNCRSCSQIQNLLENFQIAIENNSVLTFKPFGRELTNEISISCNSVHTQVDYAHYLIPDLLDITNCIFYWGKMDHHEAERLLENRQEGTFLLRDSAHEDHLFSVSFRRYGYSIHARIDQWNHKFNFASLDRRSFSSSTICGLLEHYKDSNSVLFFEPLLTNPLLRTFPFPLQHLCRAAICSRVSYNDIIDLQLPLSLKNYLKEYHYKQRVGVRHLD